MTHRIAVRQTPVIHAPLIYSKTTGKWIINLVVGCNFVLKFLCAHRISLCTANSNSAYRRAVFRLLREYGHEKRFALLVFPYLLPF